MCPRLFHILLPVLLLMGPAQRAQAQPDELTGEFGKLSAKERARIAQREESGSSQDQVFIALMADAEGLFKAQDYEGALAKFQAARARRPYNVHAKVKIEDLQALIQRREEAKVAAVQEVPPVEPPLPPLPLVDQEPVVEPAPLPTPDPVDPTEVETRTKEPAVSLEPVIDPAPKAERSTPTPQPPPSHRTMTAPALQLEEGERVYKEGRSVVVESIVAEDGHLVVYRKVSHPWGEEHYFREGATITDRAYRTAMGK